MNERGILFDSTQAGQGKEQVTNLQKLAYIFHGHLPARWIHLVTKYLYFIKDIGFLVI